MSETLDRLEALCGEGTAGPWETRGVSVRAVREGVVGGVPLANIYDREADAELIAASRAALPALIAVARAAESYLAALDVEGIADDDGLRAALEAL